MEFVFGLGSLCNWFIHDNDQTKQITFSAMDCVFGLVAILPEYYILDE
jgi:hypothetical protein